MKDTRYRRISHRHRTNSSFVFLAVCLSALYTQPSQSQEPADTRQKIDRLQQQIIEVQRDAQLKLAALQRATDAQMQRLQEQIAQLDRELRTTGTTAPLLQEYTESGQTSPARPRDRLSLSSDFRLRYEANSSDAATPSWDRGVLRGRLAGSYALTDRFTLGARLVTGDPDNPRTADTTIGDFAGDFDISLDQAYLAYQHQGMMLTGGKFANPFHSTELVWDGDVNPQGIGGHYEFFESDAWSAQFSAIYFVINQDLFEQDSNMLGSQFSLSLRPHEHWAMTLHAAYYDYSIGTLNPGAPGHARGNTLAPGGATLLSDFDLLDTMATLSYSGLGERWAVKLVADHVKNLGAAGPRDSGFGVDLYAGNLDRSGRFLFRYGYARAEADAVLGMFSHDNIVYPTNYELHTFSVDYALQEHTFVGLTNYLYRHLDPVPESLFENDWVSRTRLNLYLTF